MWSYSLRVGDRLDDSRERPDEAQHEAEDHKAEARGFFLTERAELGFREIVRETVRACDWLRGANRIRLKVGPRLPANRTSLREMGVVGAMSLAGLFQRLQRVCRKLHEMKCKPRFRAFEWYPEGVGIIRKTKEFSWRQRR